MMNFELYMVIALIAVLTLVIVVLVFAAVKSNKQLNKLESELALLDKKLTESKNALLTSLSTATSPLKSEVKETRNGFVSLRKKLQDLAAQVEQIETQQANVQVLDSESKLYRRAVKMVELGADIEEIIAECEIPRAEAELLMSLHRAAK